MTIQTQRPRWTPNPDGQRVLPIVPEEIEDFEREVKRFRDGEWEENQFMAFCLKQGVYGQRQADQQMVRVKAPFGGLTADQMDALGKIAELKQRAARASVTGSKAYNPGWHLAMDLRSLLTVSEAIARSAAERTESRGGHTRDDYQESDPEWGKWNLSLSQNADGSMKLEKTPLLEIPADLAALIEEAG